MSQLHDAIRSNELTISNWNQRKIEFLKQRQIEIKKSQYVMEQFNTDKESIVRPSYEVITLTDKCNKNEIPTFFYNLLKEGKINTTKANLIRILSSLIKDKSGDFLSDNSLKDIFNDSKPQARSKKV